MAVSRLTFFTKRRCPLCVEALAVVEKVLDELPEGIPTPHLEVVDITLMPALWERYRLEVPVLCLDDEQIFRHRVNAEKLLERIVGKGDFRTGGGN